MRGGVGDEELRILLQRVARRIRNNLADGTMSDTKMGVLFRLEAGPAKLCGDVFRCQIETKDCYASRTVGAVP